MCSTAGFAEHVADVVRVMNIAMCNYIDCCCRHFQQRRPVACTLEQRQIYRCGVSSLTLRYLRRLRSCAHSASRGGRWRREPILASVHAADSMAFRSRLSMSIVAVTPSLAKGRIYCCCACVAIGMLLIFGNVHHNHLYWTPVRTKRIATSVLCQVGHGWDVWDLYSGIECVVGLED